MVPTGGELPLLGVEVHENSLKALGDDVNAREVERFEFYSLAKSGYAVVQCAAERRPFGCFLLTMGVVGPDGKDLLP